MDQIILNTKISIYGKCRILLCINNYKSRVVLFNFLLINLKVFYIQFCKIFWRIYIFNLKYFTNHDSKYICPMGMPGSVFFYSIIKENGKTNN